VTTALRSSLKLFQALQLPHCPCQRALTSPQDWQTYRLCALAMGNSQVHVMFYNINSASRKTKKEAGLPKEARFGPQ
jgi:hypothetical protein